MCRGLRIRNPVRRPFKLTIKSPQVESLSEAVEDVRRAMNTVGTASDLALKDRENEDGCVPSPTVAVMQMGMAMQRLQTAVEPIEEAFSRGHRAARRRSKGRKRR